MGDAFLYDVFLSYHSGDRARVGELADRLNNAGLRVWFDDWSIPYGGDIFLHIEEGLARSRVLVLCISPGALRSDWVNLERSTSIFRDPSNRERRFVPLLLEPCELPDTLKRYRYIDYHRSHDAAFERLLAACRPEGTSAGSVEIDSGIGRIDPGLRIRRGRIRVILADDHELVLEGFRSLVDAEPDLDIVALVTNTDALVNAIERHVPDVVVLDVQIGPTDGLTCLPHIRTRFPNVRVLICSAYASGKVLRKAILGGASGFAVKTEPPQQTVASIRQVANGQLVFPLAARRWLLRTPQPAAPTHPTDREMEILALVSEGLTNAQIARRLRVSDNTVKFHLQNVYLKLGVRNRTEAAAHYLRHHAGTTRQRGG